MRWSPRLLGVVATLASSLALAQVDVCKPKEGVDQDLFQLKLLRLPAPSTTTQLDKQASAPATSSVSPDLVSAADFTRLLGLAVDSGLITESSGATTVNLNFFSAIAALKPEVLDQQELYEKYTNVRRLGGSITFGGKGDSFDQDGDGVIDDPKTAESAGDILTWEVRYRVYGSRDRRDKQNYRKFRAGLGAVNDEQTRALGEFAQKFTAKHPDQLTAKYFCKPDVDAFLADPLNRKAIDEFIAREAALQQEFERIADEIDNALIVTAVIGGTERKDDLLGPDKRLYAVRASYARRETTFEGNLDYNEVKSFRSAPKQESIKLGLSYNTTRMRGLIGFQEQGVLVTLAANYEKYDNVPDVAHDSIARANLKVTIPVTENVSIPLSITWANHTDLLVEEKEVRGNIGFTYDLSGLIKPVP